jgi:2-iminobutanoate/2-iminopropanoate deaminase
MKFLSLLFVAALATHMASAQSKKEVVSTKDAPHPIAPYSQAVKAGGFVFCAQIPNDPVTGNVVNGDIKAQTDRALKNISIVLAAAGSGMDHVVKATVFLKNMSDYAAMNDVYGQFFKTEPPARATIGVASLPKDALLEIDVIALQ